jgi:hypothetical protein
MAPHRVRLVIARRWRPVRVSGLGVDVEFVGLARPDARLPRLARPYPMATIGSFIRRVAEANYLDK